MVTNLDFTDRGVQLLFGSYFALILLVYLSWRRTAFELVLFIIFGIFLALLEHINAFAAFHHRQLLFSENYFDSQGVFIISFVGFPLMLVCSVIVINWLRLVWSEMVELQTLKVKRAAGKKKEAESAKEVQSEEESRKNR